MKRIVKNTHNLFEINYIFTNNTVYILFKNNNIKVMYTKVLTVHSKINLPRKKKNKMKEIFLVPLKKEQIDGPCTDIRNINTSIL